MAPRKTKAFFDAKKKSALSVERYISAKFVLHEFRSAADNKVDLEAEPFMTVNNVKMPLTFGYEGTDYDTFVNMVRPAFPKEILEKDLEAILRRATIILNTEWWVYVRPAGEKHKSVVTRYERKTPCYITPAAIATLKPWQKSGTKPNQAIFDEQVVREQTLFKQKLAPHLKVKIKLEEMDAFFDKNKKLASEFAGSAISVVDSPAKRTRTQAVASSSSNAIGRVFWKDTWLHKMQKRLSDELGGTAIEVMSDHDEEPAEAMVHEQEDIVFGHDAERAEAMAEAMDYEQEQDVFGHGAQIDGGHEGDHIQ
jgi:hypothetical protein